MSTETEELIRRTEVKNTPFVVISLNEKEHFATLGEYRITEKYESQEEAEKECKAITWNRIIQIVMILNEKLKTDNK
jgi:SHS2 domain-containing protein